MAADAREEPGDAGRSRPLLLYRVLANFLLALPVLLVVVVHSQLAGWAVFSERELMEANVMHPLFNTKDHYVEAYWNESMTQKDRLDALNLTVHRAAQALQKVGLRPFLESAGLIGWLRHSGHLPWDSDGDLGISVAECRRVNATQEALEQAIDPELEVLKFACICEQDCTGDNKRMAGRVTHRRTGVCVDIFAYAPVRVSRPWQTAARYKGVDWWERVDDHADFTFPQEALFPLQNTTWLGSTILVPNNPREFLSWEYGKCLGVHVWPWRLLLYTTVSVPVPTAILIRSAAMIAVSPWLSAYIAAYSAVTLGVLKGGIAVLLLILGSLSELGAVLLRADLCKAAQRPRYYRVVVLSLMLLTFELRGSISYLACQLDDYYIRPRRPKPWTLCLLGTCWDFNR